MRSYLDKESVDMMKKEIVDRYGPTIHGDFVEDMSVDRLSRIYINMKQLEERMYVRRDCIKGQMSLFD